MCGSIEVDVVHANTGSPDYTQFLGVLQKRSVRLHRRAHNQCISGLEMLRKLAVQLISRNHRPTGLLQLFHGCV